MVSSPERAGDERHNHSTDRIYAQAARQDSTQLVPKPPASNLCTKSFLRCVVARARRPRVPLGRCPRRSAVAPPLQLQLLLPVKDAAHAPRRVRSDAAATAHAATRHRCCLHLCCRMRATTCRRASMRASNCRMAGLRAVTRRRAARHHIGTAHTHVALVVHLRAGELGHAVR